MPCSNGAATPSSWYCEEQAYRSQRDAILQADVVHDWSHTKRVAEILYNEEHRKNVVSTLLSSLWNRPRPPFNIIVWSEAMRQRGLRGATDYENTPFLKIDQASRAGNGRITEAHVVPGGTDTDYFRPGTHKDEYFLWLGRWSLQKGYEQAIELARRTAIPLIMAGLHPDHTWAPDQKDHAVRALALAQDLPNVRF
jgi:glycosyltransferase involved in cell wall biosynthesis